MLCMVIVTWCLTDRTWPEPFLSKHTNSSCRIRKFSYLASPSRFRVSLVSMLGPSGSLIATSYHYVIVSTQCVIFVWRNPRSQFEKAPRLALAEKQGIFAFIITQKRICADRRIIAEQFDQRTQRCQNTSPALLTSYGQQLVLPCIYV